MPIDITKLNPRGKLTHLVAKDLFLPEVQQVFSAHTGKYMGLLIEGREMTINDAGEPEMKPPAIINPQQLNLF